MIPIDGFKMFVLQSLTIDLHDPIASFSIWDSGREIQYFDIELNNEFIIASYSLYNRNQVFGSPIKIVRWHYFPELIALKKRIKSLIRMKMCSNIQQHIIVDHNLKVLLNIVQSLSTMIGIESTTC